jgi:phenylacetate-CoA ligase
MSSKKSNTKQYETSLRNKPASFREREAEKNAVALFSEMSVGVPAYRDFLKKNRIQASKIKTAHDLREVPPTTKENYIQEYSLASRSWGGVMDGHSILAMSSGTSGDPSVWPRGSVQEKEAAVIHEMLFSELFEIDSYRTLMVIGFPMGVYVSGVATSIPAIAAAMQHPKLSIATVGNHKDSVLSVVKKMQKEFEQIVLVGHPFFIKDVIETGAHEGIAWNKLRVRTLFCSEGFSEAWRSYISGLVDQNPIRSIFNTYGSSEFLLVGYENPHTILLRQMAENDPLVRTALFNQPVVPNFFQYDPLIRYIEKEGEDLLISARAGVPLFRFNQHDAGTVLSNDAVHERLQNWKTAVDEQLERHGWKPWRLPFVSLLGRSDRTLVFYAANIYPEHIQSAINQKAYFKKLTGKFFMEKKYIKKMDQVLEIHLELQAGVKKSVALERALEKDVVATLERINMEYRFLRSHLEKDLTPRIVLRAYQDPHYFKPGLKPRYMAPQKK